jgi:tRNA(Arg) A34 adenosine deaminase TadA
MSESLHETYMLRCLELAETARERGEAPVGSLLVRDGFVIAEGNRGRSRSSRYCVSRRDGSSPSRLHHLADS